MQDSFIMNGDIAIVDKSLEVREGCKVVAFIDGEYVMKTIKIGKGEIYIYKQLSKKEENTKYFDGDFQNFQKIFIVYVKKKYIFQKFIISLPLEIFIFNMNNAG